MNRKRKAYLISSLFFFFVAFIIVSYPIANFYFTKYTRSSHEVSKGEFTYFGTFPAFYYGSQAVVLNFKGLGNGSFELNASLYDITNAKTLRFTWEHGHLLSKNGLPFYYTGNISREDSVHLILNSSDPIIKLFFPKVSDPYVRLLFKPATTKVHGKMFLNNKTFVRDFKIVPAIPPTFKVIWRPYTWGFPTIYTPNISVKDFPGIANVESPVEYMKGNDRYFARKIDMSANLSAGLTPQEIGLMRIFKKDQKVIEGMYFYHTPTSYPIYLARASVTPSQDWAWAFKYSFTSYAAPVDYVLILIGLILLVLAGRAKG